MCFSNLPIEFDDAGNPYLGDEADDVERPDSTTREADGADPVEIEVAPERVYDAIVNSLPDGARHDVILRRGEPTLPSDSGAADIESE